MSMITSLTPEQEAQLPAFRDKWIDIGLATIELNVDKSLELIRAIYSQQGLTPPTDYRVFNSPMAAIKGIKDEFNVDVTPSDFCYGLHDASSLAFYDVFRTLCDIKACDQLSHHSELAKYCGWWLAYDDLIVLTAPPSVVKMDDNNLAHNETGYAIEYPDGYGVAIWHGTRVPSEWIFDKTSITTEVALKWPDTEQRRAACEIVGWENVISKLNPVIIDKDVDEEVGELLQVDIPEIGKELFLRVRCGTGRYFSLPVPPTMETALEANSWTYGIDKIDFKPDFRT